MSRCNLSSSSSPESDHVIGYFKTISPSIPDAVIVERNGKKVKVYPDRSEIPCSDQDMNATRKVSLDIGRDDWVAVKSDGGPVVVKMSELENWKAKESFEAIQAAMQTRGDPMRALQLLEGAAKLRSLNLSDFVTKLKETRAPSESLDQAFLRLRTAQEKL